MRLLTFIVSLLLLLIQYPLWLGKGGWLHVWELDRHLRAQERENVMLRERNQRLIIEIKDLKGGLEAIEERARFEMGMIRQDEHFVQIIQPSENSLTQP